MVRIAIPILTLAATAGAIAVAQPAGAPRSAASFVAKAGASDLFEIQSSQLAQTKARRTDVRDFAAMLVKDHTDSSQKVMAAAKNAGLNPPPPRLEPQHEQMMRRLRNASAAQFDRVYLSVQVPAHQQALALHQNYARNGDTPALKTVASALVPVVQHHLEHARKLRTRR